MKRMPMIGLLSALATVIGFSAPACAQPTMATTHHMAFAVAQDILVDASPARLLDLFQDAKLWAPHIVSRDLVAGPAKGVGADYKVQTKRGDDAMTRRELTIVADDKRVVLHVLSEPPALASTFIEFSATPEGKATRATFKIYVDASMPSVVPASMIPAIVKQNEEILAGHLQRIKAVAEKK